MKQIVLLLQKNQIFYGGTLAPEELGGSCWSSVDRRPNFEIKFLKCNTTKW
jgi:hypothetical protein